MLQGVPGYDAKKGSNPIIITIISAVLAAVVSVPARL